MGAKPSIDKLRQKILKFNQGLRDDLDAGAQPDAFCLASEIVHACNAHGYVTPYGTIFTVNHFGIDLYGAWQTKTAQQYFKENIKQPDDISPWVEIEFPPFERVALDTLGPRLLVCETEDGPIQHYVVDDPIERTCHPINVGKKSDLTAIISRIIAPACKADNVVVTAFRASAAYQAFISFAPFQPAPALLGQRGDDGWCLHRQRLRPNANVSYPRIQEFLDRLPDPDAYSAWWYGVAFGLNRGRQGMFLADPVGQSGKSALQRALAQALFGDRIYSSFPPSLNLADRFTLSHFVSKKLVVIGDCKDPYVLHRGIVKELLGDDKSHVQRKFEQPFSTHLQCRLMIASNMLPFIVSARHNTTRTLFQILEPLELTEAQIDPYYGAKCVPEIPGWLAYAEDCYRRLCPNNYNISTNDKVQQATAVRIAECEAEHSELFDEYFVVDPNEHITSKDWNRILKEARLDKHEMDNLLQWVQAMFNTEIQLAANSRSWLMEGIKVRSIHDTNHRNTFSEL